MPSNPLNTLVQQLRAAVERDGAGRSDGELLTRFLSQRDHDALASLVRRHAPMVWGVCRRVLRSHHDAEDAFQATFIVLVRKAATVVPREMVANWLFGVAQQTAVRLRATAAKRSVREMQKSEFPEAGAAAARDDELLSLLDQELSRLPERSRTLIVLCDLEGKSRRDVARQLGCPEGTVASGLARARQLLAKRMARHGPAFSGVTLAAALANSVASASVPPAVVASTIHVATSVAAGTAVGVISGPVAALAQQVVKAMFLKKLTTMTTILAALTVAAITLGNLAIGQTEGALQPKDQQPLAEKPVDSPAKEQEKEPFTAWGKEVGGLQAGLGFSHGGKRVYRVGESVSLVVRVRNISKETIDFRYIRAFFFENPPTITDADGNRIQLLKLTGDGRQFPRDAKLSPGQAADIFDWSVSLLPKGDSGAKGSYAIHGTGKFNLQCERVVGPTLSNPNHPDPARDKLASGTLELEVEPAAAAHAEKEPFTAWGKEVGGLQAGLGIPLGAHRAYRHGESVRLVLRVRNVSKETVDFSYIWAFFIENPPTIMDPDGQRIQLPKYAGLGLQHPRDAKLAPGKEVDIFDWDLDLRPKGESGRKGVLTIHGTGTFSLQCERVVGPTSGNPNHPDPAREKLATGKLELEIKPAAPNAEKEPFTAWGKEVGGLQAGLGFPLGGKRAYRHGESVALVLRVRNVSKETVDFSYIWAFFIENPPTITDPDGKRIQLPNGHGLGLQQPRDAKLAPGQEADLFDWGFDLRPKGESGRRGVLTIHGTGMFSLQCERVVGPTSANPNHPDPARDKLATGKLELEIQPAAANAEKEPFTAWGKEVGGLQAGLCLPLGGNRRYRHGEAVVLVVRIRNVGKEAVKFEYPEDYFLGTPPTVTDAKGKSIPQPELIVRARLDQPVTLLLEPGKEIRTRPLSDRTLAVTPGFGTGKVEVQYERVFANSRGGNVTVDPALRDLATGKLELEIEPAARASEEITLNHTRIRFAGSMTSNESPLHKGRTTTFRDQVRAFHFPGGDPNVADPTTPVKGSLLLTCERLVVTSRTMNEKLGEKVVEKSYQEILADGGDRLVTFRMDEFTGNAKAVKFDEQTDVILFEGTDGAPVTIHALPKEQGGQPKTLQGRRILFNRKTHEFQLDGVKAITP